MNTEWFEEYRRQATQSDAQSRSDLERRRRDQMAQLLGYHAALGLRSGMAAYPSSPPPGFGTVVISHYADRIPAPVSQDKEILASLGIEWP